MPVGVKSGVGGVLDDGEKPLETSLGVSHPHGGFILGFPWKKPASSPVLPEEGSRGQGPWGVGEGLFPFPPSCFPIGQRPWSFVIS